MTRQDYRLIAEVINNAVKVCGVTDQLEAVALALAVSLKHDNIHFNRGKFLVACGIPEVTP